jgi:hypothetical protein
MGVGDYELSGARVHLITFVHARICPAFTP